MKVVQSLRHIIESQLVARDRKRNFQILARMTDRELNDIGLPREYLYSDSANQRRHVKLSKSEASGQEHAA